METKHISGPWSYQPEKNIVIAQGNDQWIHWQAQSMNLSQEQRHANFRLISASPELMAAARAALAYDEAIRSCADGPDRMASFCTAQGEDLDSLYLSWVNLSAQAIAKATGSAL